MDKKNVFMVLMFGCVLFNMGSVFASPLSTISGWVEVFGKKIAPYFAGLGVIIVFPVAFGFFRKLLSVPMQIILGFAITGVVIGGVGILPNGVGSSARDFLNKIIGRIGG